MFGYQGSDCILKVGLTAGCELKQNFESRGLGTLRFDRIDIEL